MFYAYMLECGDGSFYVGQTDDLPFRLSEHQSGQGGAWTSRRLPVKLVWQAAFSNRDDAKRAEEQIKGWNRAKKRALVEGRFDLIQELASRGATGRALRDALLRRAPQERGP
jgi:putative endonuclease